MKPPQSLKSVIKSIRNGYTITRKGVKNPDKSKEVIRAKLTQPIVTAASYRARRKYPAQRDKIRSLQADESQRWLLIVLDACRYDRFKILFDDYFNGSVEPISAAGVDTFKYVGKNWPGQYDLPYITAAAPVTNTNFDFENNTSVEAQGVRVRGDRLKKKYEGYVPRDHLNRIIEVWRTDWDEELGVCPPEPVTESAIDICREEHPDNAVVHYFQPHAPFIGETQVLDDRDEIDSRLEGGAIAKNVWERVKSGEITDKELVELYDENLKRVLDSVVTLISETDFDRTIIMGDHGEALGEFDRYGHGIEHPHVRIVPWAEIASVNEHHISEHQQSTQSQSTETDPNSSVVNRLQELGYID